MQWQSLRRKATAAVSRCGAAGRGALVFTAFTCGIASPRHRHAIPAPRLSAAAAAAREHRAPAARPVGSRRSTTRAGTARVQTWWPALAVPVGLPPATAKCKACQGHAHSRRVAGHQYPITGHRLITDACRRRVRSGRARSCWPTWTAARWPRPSSAGTAGTPAPAPLPYSCNPCGESMMQL